MTLNTHINATYTPNAQIFVLFALRWAIFELRPSLGKRAVNDPKMTLTSSGPKVRIPHTSPRAKISPFLSYAPF